MMLSSESNIVMPYTNTPKPSSAKDRRWKGVNATSEVAPNCPRCDSSNTKFCYYNNYSLTQPRYFCKGCRRYWTKGGSLRNVPVGGGCRKNRRAGAATSKNLHRPSNSRNFRPDLVLDDPVGNASADTSRSDIDLAVLYSKFTNQSTSGEPNAASNPSSQFHQQIQFDQNFDFATPGIRVDSALPSFNTVSTKYVPFQTDFNLGTSCSSELLLDESITNDLFWSNYPIWLQPLPNPSGYGPIQDDPSMVLNQSGSAVLNTNFGMLDSSCFQTFSR